MSYNCYLSFKKLLPNQIMEFLAEYKRLAFLNLHVIAKEYCHCAPFTQDPRIEANTLSKQEKLDIANQIENQHWFYKVFQVRYFYDPQKHLLGFFGVPTCMRSLFDATYQFQDSADQNYDFEYWDGIDEFAFTVNKWATRPRHDIASKFKRIYEHDMYEDCTTEEEKNQKADYYRKVFLYEAIWKPYEKYLTDDKLVIYYSPFGYEEVKTVRSFLNQAYYSYMEVLDNE